MKQEKVCYHLNVSGDVQGVFFRVSAKDEAEKLGLTGYARNEADGSVAIEVEGSQADIKEFIKWAESGPKHARVNHVSAKSAPLQHYASFTVL